MDGILLMQTGLRTQSVRHPHPRLLFLGSHLCVRVSVSFIVIEEILEKSDSHIHMGEHELTTFAN